MHVQARMLPSNHAAVQACLHRARDKKVHGGGRKVGEKWIAKHNVYKQMTGVPGFRGATSSMPLTSQRQREAWGLLEKRHGRDGGYWQ